MTCLFMSIKSNIHICDIYTIEKVWAQYMEYRALFPFCTMTAAKSLQSCPTLCDPRDGNPPGSPIPGILQARTLEWVAISFSNAWKWKSESEVAQSCLTLRDTMIAVYQARPPMGFSRQEYWSGLPLPSPTMTATNSKYWTDGMWLS